MKKIILLVLLVLFIGCFEKSNLESNGSIFGYVNLDNISYIKGIDIGGSSIKIKGTNLTTITDIKGKFVFRDIKPGEYVLSITRNDFISKEIKIKVVSGSVTSTNVNLEYIYSIIKGYLKYDKELFKNTTIRLSNFEEEKYSFDYNKQGFFSKDKIEPNTYEIEVLSKGFKAIRRSINFENNKIIDLGELTSDYVYGGLKGKISLIKEDNNISFKVKIFKNQVLIKDKIIKGENDFSFNEIDEGNYRIEIENENYLTIDKSVTIVKNQILNLGSLTMLKKHNSSGYVVGKCLLEDDITNVDKIIEISVENSSGDIKNFLSDEYGSYYLESFSGNNKIKFSKENFEPQFKEIITYENELLNLEDITLNRKKQDFKGKIVLAGRENYSNILVKLKESNLIGNNEELSALTNNEGEFIFEKVNYGILYDIEIIKEKFDLISQKSLLFKDKDESEFFYEKILLPKKSKIEGFVELDKTDIYIGIECEIIGNKIDENGEEVLFSKKVKTDNSGKYLFTDIPYGEYDINYSFPGYISRKLENINILPDENLVIDELIFMNIAPLNGNIKGIVKLSGENNFSGIEIIAINKNNEKFETLTDSEGIFIYPELPEGEYNLTFSKFYFKSFSLDKIIVKSSTTTELENEIELIKKNGIINGKITLEGRENYKGIKISLIGTYLNKGFDVISVETNENGNFEINAPVSVIYNGLIIEKDSYFEKINYKLNFELFEDTPFVLKNENNKNFIIKNNYNDLMGNIKFEKENRNSEIEIQLVNKNSDLIIKGNPDTNGNYEFKKVLNGDYIIYFSHEFLSKTYEKEITVKPSENIKIDNIMLKSEAGTLSGEVQLKNEIYESKINILLKNDINSYTTQTDSNGRFNFYSIEQGEYLLNISKNGWENFSKEIEIVKNESLELKEIIELKDDSPPKINEILINGGAEFTSDTTILLNMNVENAGSALETILVSEESGFNEYTDLSFKNNILYTIKNVKENIMLLINFLIS